MIKKSLDVSQSPSSLTYSPQVKKVKVEDISEIAKEIRCDLILQNIPFESIEQLIIPEDLELKGKV